jgi:pimeloyl-ACP methyl ester carboxylesterase
VWEDRQRREGRRLKLKVAVARALAAQPAPDPLFILAGGPGQSATAVAGKVLPALERVRRTRDVVFVDQRGTGGSNPLDCGRPPEEATFEDRLRTDLDVEELKACLARYDADVRHYGTTAAMEDLDAVREALGYERVNLYGGSYGTRAALEYARRHPGRLRAMVLDGVAPMSLYLPLSLAKDAQRALEQLFADCAADARCAAAYPKLPERFAALLARLDAGPVRARVPDPLTGRPQEAEVSRELFTASLRALLYVPDASTLVPLLVDRAAAGDFAPLLASGGQVRADGMAMGLFLSVMCAEDAPFLTAADVAREAEGTWLGAGMGQRMLQACEVWPRGEVREDFRQPVRSDVPTLLLSGALDPVTPPSHAEAAAATLTRALHVTVPGTGHGTVGVPCARDLMVSFLEKGEVQGLTPACPAATPRPPFFLGFADAAPAGAVAAPSPTDPEQVTR